MSYNKLIDIPVNYVVFVGIVALILTYDCGENSEHLITNLDSQAIQNLASIVNNGTTTLNNLHITGALTVDGGGTFGNTFIGESAGGWGGITHVSQASGGKITGNNKDAGIQFKDNSIIIGASPTIRGALNVSGGGTFGNAFIGNSTGSWGGVTHISQVSDGIITGNNNDAGIQFNAANSVVINGKCNISPTGDIVGNTLTTKDWIKFGQGVQAGGTGKSGGILIRAGDYVSNNGVNQDWYSIGLEGSGTAYLHRS